MPSMEYLSILRVFSSLLLLKIFWFLLYEKSYFKFIIRSFCLVASLFNLFLLLIYLLLWYGKGVHYNLHWIFHLSLGYWALGPGGLQAPFNLVFIISYESFYALEVYSFSCIIWLYVVLIACWDILNFGCMKEY